MKREDVYKLIDGERDYQNIQAKKGKTYYSEEPYQDQDHSISDWLIYIEKHLQIAKDNIYQLNNQTALNEVRKITALGVACMEHNETEGR